MQQRPMKRATQIDTFYTDIKTRADNLDVDKINTALANLSKLNDVADNDVAKKTMYNKLVI